MISKDTFENPRTRASFCGSPTIRDPFGKAIDSALLPSRRTGIPRRRTNSAAFRKETPRSAAAPDSAPAPGCPEPRSPDAPPSPRSRSFSPTAASRVGCPAARRAVPVLAPGRARTPAAPAQTSPHPEFPAVVFWPPVMHPSPAAALCPNVPPQIPLVPPNSSIPTITSVPAPTTHKPMKTLANCGVTAWKPLPAQPPVN